MNTAILATRPASTARAYRLTIDGQDFLNPTVTTGYGIDKTSIRLTEAGPPNVSSLSFTINDPAVQAAFQEAAVVEFWDITRDRPLFLGFMQGFSIRPTAIGRVIEVDCIGIEVLLDWMVVPSLTVPAMTEVRAAIQACVANATGIGWTIRAAAGVGTEAASSQALPLGTPSSGSPTVTEYDVVIAGMSLRDAISACIVACANPYATGGDVLDAVFWIDFYSGLRFAEVFTTAANSLAIPPQDLVATLSIENLMSGTIAAHSLDFATNSAGVPHAVYVTGGNAAGTGLVSDGSGIIGMVAQLSDDTILTTAQRDIVGLSYLSEFGTSLRGSMSLDPISAAMLAITYRPVSRISFLVDAQVFGETTTYNIDSIDKTFADLREGWTIHYGGAEPSAIKQIRRLTRDVRS